MYYDGKKYGLGIVICSSPMSDVCQVWPQFPSDGCLEVAVPVIPKIDPLLVAAYFSGSIKLAGRKSGLKHSNSGFLGRALACLFLATCNVYNLKLKWEKSNYQICL